MGTGEKVIQSLESYIEKWISLAHRVWDKIKDKRTERKDKRQK
jgi:hypothetical protein